MITRIDYPPKADWEALCCRPQIAQKELSTQVSKIIANVEKDGDNALKAYALQFDGVHIEDLRVTEQEWVAADQAISKDLKIAIEQAIKNIDAFHRPQWRSEKKINTMEGIRCWRKSVAIEKVGLYIPAGTAALFSSLLMLGIPAKIAGCTEIVVCSPAGKDNKIHPTILYTAKRLGIRNVFKIGGAQAIAAMALGTESIPRVYKILGPGNPYVTEAKMQLSAKGVAIDMPAGPSELLLVADKTGNPQFLAADILSQAEHGIDSQVMLLSDSATIIQETMLQLKVQIAKLSRGKIAEQALANSKAILVDSIASAIQFANQYAPEHLIIACKDNEKLADQIYNAGSVFLGNNTPEAAGDYASGTNHSLPTNRHAQAYSGVSVDSFIKKITFQKISAEGLRNIGDCVQTMALAEGLSAHAQAIKIRLDNETCKTFL